MALISTLIDAFDVAGAPDAKWVFDNLGLSGYTVQAAGVLELGATTNVAWNNDATLTTVSSYDLKNSSIYVKLATPASYAGGIDMTSCFFRIHGPSAPTSEFVAFTQNSDSSVSFDLTARNSGGWLYYAPYTWNAATMCWWRFTCNTTVGRIYFDVAGSGASN